MTPSNPNQRPPWMNQNRPQMPPPGSAAAPTAIPSGAPVGGPVTPPAAPAPTGGGAPLGTFYQPKPTPPAPAPTQASATGVNAGSAATPQPAGATMSTGLPAGWQQTMPAGTTSNGPAQPQQNVGYGGQPAQTGGQASVTGMNMPHGMMPPPGSGPQSMARPAMAGGPNSGTQGGGPATGMPSGPQNSMARPNQPAMTPPPSPTSTGAAVPATPKNPALQQTQQTGVPANRSAMGPATPGRPIMQNRRPTGT